MRNRFVPFAAFPPMMYNISSFCKSDPRIRFKRLRGWKMVVWVGLAMSMSVELAVALALIWGWHPRCTTVRLPPMEAQDAEPATPLGNFWKKLSCQRKFWVRSYESMLLKRLFGS